MSGRTVGCHKLIQRTRVDIFGDRDDWNAHHQEYHPCDFCFADYQLPRGWTRPTRNEEPSEAPPPTLADTDSEPDCDPEDATDSEQEVDSDADDFGVTLEPATGPLPQGQKRPHMTEDPGPAL